MVLMVEWMKEVVLEDRTQKGEEETEVRGSQGLYPVLEEAFTCCIGVRTASEANVDASLRDEDLRRVEENSKVNTNNVHPEINFDKN